MSSQDERNQRVQRQVEMRLRERSDKIPDSEVPFHQTIKHLPEDSPKPWMKKVIFGLKLFGIGVAVLVAVRVAAVLAGFVITATLIWIVYKLFFESRK